MFSVRYELLCHKKGRQMSVFKGLKSVLLMSVLKLGYKWTDRHAQYLKEQTEAL